MLETLFSRRDIRSPFRGLPFGSPHNFPHLDSRRFVTPTHPPHPEQYLPFPPAPSLSLPPFLFICGRRRAGTFPQKFPFLKLLPRRSQASKLFQEAWLKERGGERNSVRLLVRKVAGSVGRRVSRELEARVEIQSTVLLTTNSLRPAQLLISLPNRVSVIFPSISTQTCVCVCDRLILSSDFRPCFLYERAPPNKLGEENMSLGLWPLPLTNIRLSSHCQDSGQCPTDKTLLLSCLPATVQYSILRLSVDIRLSFPCRLSPVFAAAVVDRRRDCIPPPLAVYLSVCRRPPGQGRSCSDESDLLPLSLPMWSVPAFITRHNSLSLSLSLPPPFGGGQKWPFPLPPPWQVVKA